MVLSARGNFRKRNLIRQTYGSIRKANNVKVLAIVFMLGNSDEPGAERTDSSELEAERDLFGDIVMGDLVDSYRNLTLKTIMAYEWLSSYCSHAQIVVKTDDDVFVNIFKLTEVLAAWTPAEVASSNIWCAAVHYNEDVISDVGSRFYASLDEFPSGKFPDHCAGVGYITSMDVIDKIIGEISKSFLGKVCTHEDVFMTSIARQKANLNQNYFWRQPQPIKLINMVDTWLTYDLETYHDTFLLHFLQQAINETENIGEYRKRFETKIFYLLRHSDDYERIYLRLWRTVEEEIINKRLS